MTPSVSRFVSTAVTKGHDAESVLKFLMQQTPKIAPQIQQALQAGHSPENIVKFLGAPNEGATARRYLREGKNAPEAVQQRGPEQVRAQKQTRFGKAAATAGALGLGAAALEGVGGAGGIIQQIIQAAGKKGVKTLSDLKRVAGGVLKQSGVQGDDAREVMKDVEKAAKGSRRGLADALKDRFNEAYGADDEQFADAPPTAQPPDAGVQTGPVQQSEQLPQQQERPLDGVQPPAEQLADMPGTPGADAEDPWGIPEKQREAVAVVNENNMGGLLTALLDGGNTENGKKFARRKLSSLHGDADEYLSGRGLSVDDVVDEFDSFLKSRDDTLPQGQDDSIDVDITSRPVPRSKIKSSVIKGFVYNPEKQEVVVRFNKGAVYKYSNVPQSVVDSMARGADSATTEGKNEFGYWWIGKNPSVGATFVRQLRNGGFEYEKIKGNR